MFPGFLAVRLLAFTAPLHHQGDLPPDLNVFQAAQHLANPPAQDLLVNLGQLPCQGDPPVAQDFQEILERLNQPVGGFEENQCSGEASQRLQDGPPLAALPREEPCEGVPVGWKARDNQRSGDRARPRDRNNRNTFGDGPLDEHAAGVGDRRHPGVGEEGDGLPCAETGEEPFCALPLVVCMVAHQGLGKVVPGEELARPAGVLAGDEIHLLKDAQGAQGDILKVPNGGPHDVQLPRHLIHLVS